MPERLKEIQARLEKATPDSYWVRNAYMGAGEWNTSKSSDGTFSGEPCPSVPNEYMAQRDCELAACAPADLAYLLDRLAKAEIACVAAQQLIDEASPTMPPSLGAFEKLDQALATWQQTQRENR